MSPILDPFTVIRLIGELSDAEADELLQLFPEPLDEDPKVCLNYVTGVSAWLLARRARKAGGGVQ